MGPSLELVEATGSSWEHALGPRHSQGLGFRVVVPRDYRVFVWVSSWDNPSTLNPKLKVLQVLRRLVVRGSKPLQAASSLYKRLQNRYHPIEPYRSSGSSAASTVEAIEAPWS